MKNLVDGTQPVIHVLCNMRHAERRASCGWGRKPIGHKSIFCARLVAPRAFQRMSTCIPDQLAFLGKLGILPPQD